jgi:hypothetical protein
MITRAAQRATSNTNHAAIHCRCLAIENLHLLADNRYDGVISNFSGLNCVEDLQRVAHNFSKLVRPGGRAVVCLFGTRCLWEILWNLRTLNFRKAFRRFQRRGVKATLGADTTVTVYYRPVSSVSRIFAPYFQLKRTVGVGVAVPPSYAGVIPARFPALFRIAEAVDPVLGRCPMVWSLADHVILTFERSEVAP